MEQAIEIGAIRWSRWAPAGVVAAILVATLFTRLGAFGDPSYSADDAVFLLIGDGLRHGLLPYVDLWDRKPIGTFLLFAAIRQAGGDGIVAAQVAAGAAAFMTALLLFRVARLSATILGSTLAAVAYLLWLSIFGGAAAQITVFYNLLMLAAGAMVLVEIRHNGPPRRLSMALSMAFVGLAMLCKQTVAVEGALFAISFLLLAWKRGANLRSVLTDAALMMVVAAAPTGTALAYFQMTGHLQDYWFATVTSNGLRKPDLPGRIITRLVLFNAELLPLAILAAWGYRRRLAVDPQGANFLLVWVVVAYAAMLLTPRFYVYYFTPLLVPLSLLAAQALNRIAAILLILWPSLFVAVWNGGILQFGYTRSSIAAFDAVRDEVVARSAPNDRLLLLAGPPQLYLSTGRSPSTPYVYPLHLMADIEGPALPIPQAEAIRRAFAAQPSVIIAPTVIYNDVVSHEVTETLRQELRAYRFVGARPVVQEGRPVRIGIWVRR